MENQFEQPSPALPSEITSSSEPASAGSSALPPSAESVIAALPFGKTRPPYVQIRDIGDILWDVRDIRACAQGVRLVFGYPAKPLLRRKRGPVGRFRPILTSELAAFIKANHHDLAIYDLPVSRRMIDLFIRRVCFAGGQDRRLSIRRRRTALPEPPSIRDFAYRYQVSLEEAEEWRMLLLDPSPRSHRWWRDPAPLAVLRSSVDLTEVARTLGISSAHASRLRRRALALDKARLSRAPRKLSPIAR